MLEWTRCIGIVEHGAGLMLMAFQCCLAVMHALQDDNSKPGANVMSVAAAVAHLSHTVLMCPMHR